MRVYPSRPLTADARNFRSVGAAWTALVLAVLLVGCGSSEAPSQPTSDTSATAETSQAESSRPAAPPDGANAAARGEQALRDQRLFLPAADNAFEFFVAAVEANPGDERSRLALQDLVPYAVLHIEQRLAADDAEDAARVIALLERAAGQAPALPRLQAGLENLQTRQAAARAVAEAAAARAANPTSVVPVPANPVVTAPPSSAAVPAASAPAAVATPPPASPPADNAPTSAPSSPSTPAPAAAVPTPAAVRVPEVVFRPALRYPALAERRRIEGFVEMEFTIGADGSVSQLEVLRSEPEGMFEREALAAMERWRFAPPQAPMRARRTLEFKLSR